MILHYNGRSGGQISPFVPYPPWILHASAHLCTLVGTVRGFICFKIDFHDRIERERVSRMISRAPNKRIPAFHDCFDRRLPRRKYRVEYAHRTPPSETTAAAACRIDRRSGKTKTILVQGTRKIDTGSRATLSCIRVDTSRYPRGKSRVPGGGGLLITDVFWGRGWRRSRGPPGEATRTTWP